MATVCRQLIAAFARCIGKRNLPPRKSIQDETQGNESTIRGCNHATNKRIMSCGIWLVGLHSGLFQKLSIPRVWKTAGPLDIQLFAFVILQK